MANKSYHDCIGVIQKAAGEWLTDGQAKQLLDEIDNIAQIKKASGQLEGINKLVLNDLDGATNALKESALIEKRNALINQKVRTNILAQVRKFALPGDGVKALLAGQHVNVSGALGSIDATGQAITNKFLGQLINGLEKGNLLPIFNSGKFDKEIAIELWQLPHGEPGITKVPEAKAIADLIHGIQNEVVYRQNRAGAFIKLMPGYIVRQAHDMFKIRADGFEKWAAAVLPKLDGEKTFGTMDPEQFLKEAFEGFSTGMHYKVKGESAADSMTYFLGFKGPSNLARKVSEERVLHFKGAESWHDYNEIYGKQNLREAVIGGIEHSAHNAALMEGLGTNPLAMLDDILKVLRSENKGDTKAFDSLKDYTIHNLYMQLDGTARIPVYHKLAMMGSAVRIIQNVSKLGGAVLSSVTDIPFQAAALRLNGRGLLESYGGAFANLLRGRGNAEQREIAHLVGVGFDGIIKDIASRFSAEDTPVGRMSKMQQKYFKLNLMNWWNDSHKTGVALTLSAHLAEQRGKTFADLPEMLKRSLGHYNIGAKDWELVKQTSYQAEDGHWYFTPDRIGNIEDSRVIEHLGINKTQDPSVTSRVLRETKDAIETKFRTYLVDQINHAVPHPGAAEAALLTGPTQPGTVLGEALRFIMQFKSFPLTAVRKGLAPHLYQGTESSWIKSLAKGEADYTGLVHLMVGTTIFGYLAGMAKDTVQGVTPRDPKDPNTWVKAMAQGGGLGIYGDFLFGEFNRYGHSALSTAMGPTAAQFEDVMKLYSRARDGDKVAGQTLRLALNNTPFGNLFYTKAAMDYMFLYQLQESVNPGYLSRMEGRIMKENKQSFYLPPTQQIPYGGGDKFLEGVR